VVDIKYELNDLVKAEQQGLLDGCLESHARQQLAATFEAIVCEVAAAAKHQMARAMECGREGGRIVVVANVALAGQRLPEGGPVWVKGGPL
jgi:hypothetical protein